MFRRLVVLSLLILTAATVAAQERIRIWGDGEVKHSKQVTLTPFIAENNIDGTSVIICPGGSYFWLAKMSEGDDVARWFQSQGISAFVLRYRAATWGAYFFHYRLIFRGHQHPDMLLDAQQAIKYVKEHSKEYHIDPDRLGIIGFSAGGHLAMMTTCFSDREENHPAFAGSIYPVVTMNEPYVHKRSRRALLGEYRKNDAVWRDSLSLELQVPDDCPPVFIVNCVDDPTVDYHNSILLDSTLTAKNIKHRFIQYNTGGHGFGVSEVKGSEECRNWKYEFIEWLDETGF